MKIWIDLANSPHVQFFLPIIKQLKADKHDVLITMRDFAETIELARKYNIDAEIIGRHGGGNFFNKFLNLIERTTQLTLFARNRHIDIAISHNSYTQIMASRIARIRTVTIMDYEGQPANHLAFRLAHKIIVPNSFPDPALTRFGASPQRTYKYDGFKEQIYLSDYIPNQSFPQDMRLSCGLDSSWDIDKTILVTVRTPATMAVYHHFENPLFVKLLDMLNARDDLTTVLLPRTLEQKSNLKIKYPNLNIPSYPLDGKDLTYYSDFVISAGGTMNREAAILGTPAYSLFAGAFPAVDTKLIQLERMIHIASEKDFSKIRFEKKKPGKVFLNHGLTKEIMNEFFN